MGENKQPLLSIEDLVVSFSQYSQGFDQIDLEVIHNLSVDVYPGEIVAVVGSSGSGKSLLAHAVLGLLPSNCNASGYVRFNGELLDAERIKELRGKEISLVPQGVTFLDPLEKVGKQVRNGRTDQTSVARQHELFEYYGLESEVEELYPFELSGGMARRVLLSASLAENPKLVIADEPTPGLHLEAAKKAMRHFRDFADAGGGVLLITHDIELSLEVADRIAIFYAGTTLEIAKAEDFKAMETLRHPYTQALWRAFPANGFHPSPGTQPYAKDVIEGCPFGKRCELFSEECKVDVPLRELRGGFVRCVKAS